MDVLNEEVQYFVGGSLAMMAQVYGSSSHRWL